MKKKFGTIKVGGTDPNLSLHAIYTGRFFHHELLNISY